MAEEISRLKAELSARDAFLAVIGHELRNPMTPILTQVQKLRRQQERGTLAGEQIGPALAALEAHVLRFVRRATSLLDVSRAREGLVALHPRRIDVAGIVGMIVDQSRPAAAHARSTLIYPSTDPVTGWADPLVVEQVAENLVTNAIKYGRGAPVRVSVRDDGGWTLLVEDGGPGIPHKDRERVFSKFERLAEAGPSAGGFGVGLWLVRELVRAMGGTIEVGTSDLGGAAVIVRAPWSPDRVGSRDTKE